MARLAVLASGTGSVLEAILHARLPVKLVVADRPCPALDIASDHGIATRLIDRAVFGYSLRGKWDRAGFTAALVKQLHQHEIDLIAMAGFMTVLTSEIFEAYPERILNTHPSLLPAFRGANAVRQALMAGIRETGCTVHVATTELDSGPVLASVRVPVRRDDTEVTLHERIKQAERRLYPVTIRHYLETMLPG